VRADHREETRARHGPTDPTEGEGRARVPHIVRSRVSSEPSECSTETTERAFPCCVFDPAWRTAGPGGLLVGALKTTNTPGAWVHQVDVYACVAKYLLSAIDQDRRFPEHECAIDIRGPHRKTVCNR